MPASPPLLPVLALLLGALSLFGAAPAEAQQTRTYALTASVSAAEGSNAELTVTLGEAAPPGGLAFGVSYDYSVSGATAADTGTTPSTVTVSQGSTTATISVPLLADRDGDTGETFTVKIAPASGVTGWSVAAGGTDTSTVTITDDAASVTFEQAAYSFNEFDGSRPVWFHARALSSIHDPGLGRTTSTDGTATGGGVDYGFSGSSFQFFPERYACDNNLSGCGRDVEPVSHKLPRISKSVNLINDQFVEDDETFTVTLVPPPGWSAKPHATTKVTIIDDDRVAAKIAFGADPAGTLKYTASVDEDVTGGTLDVPVTVSHLPGSSTTFDIEVLATGTAIEGADYRIDTKSVTFGPTDKSKTKNLSVAITNDPAVEPAETIELRIAAADRPKDDLGDHYARDENGSRATLTIANDDAKGLTLTTSAANDTAAEDVGTVTVTATLNRPVLEREVTVTLLAGSGSTATAADDYALPAAFRIAAGETSATATVTIVDDDLDEDDERLVLTAAAGGLTVAGVTLTITDDDTAGVTVSTRTLSVTAGGTAGYTVVLDSKPTANVTVTPASSARARAKVSSALTFTPSNWSTAQPVTVTGVAAGTAVITHTADSTDADYTSSLAIDSVSVTVSSSRAFWITPEVTGAEGGNAELTATLGEAAPAGGLAFDVSYDYSVGGATAADTGTTPSTVTVSQGRTTAMFSVPIQADRTHDNGETFRVTIAPASGVSGWSVASGGTATATVTITDDAASVTFNQAAYTFAESSRRGTVWYHAQGLSYVTEEFGRITSTDGTATGGGVDYSFVGGGFSESPEQHACRNGLAGCGHDQEPVRHKLPDRSRTVTVVDDAFVEEDETFTITLAPPTGWSAMPHATTTVTITDDDRAVAKIAFGSRAGGQSKYTASVAEDVTGGRSTSRSR